MKNLFNFNIKSIVLGKARWLLTFIAIFTLGMGQMWANTVGFESYDCGIQYTHNGGSKTEWNFSGQSNNSQTLAGNTTSLSLKEWFARMYQENDGDIYGKDYHCFVYKIHRTAVAPGTTGFTTKQDANWWNWNSWDGSGKWRKPNGGNNSEDINLISGLGSGKYSMTFYFLHKGSSDFKSTVDTLKWTIGVPSVSSGAVTSDGSGTGESGSPFLVADGNTLTLTAGGSQSSTDANSVLYVKWGSDSYAAASSTTKTITPTTTKQSITVKLKYYNSADNLSGSETTLTIYYQSTVTPSVGISSFTQDETTVTSVNSGESLSINASRQNAGTASITYQYSTNGSSWTTISSTTATSVSWTAPATTATTTYYIRAQMTYESTTYTSSSATLKVYGKKTIKVKNTNGWASMLMHRWDGDRTATSWPGEAAQISAYGSGQWKQVALYSSNTSFALVDGSNNDNHTADQTYAGVTDGYCYQIQSGTGGSLTLTSTANCPAKPSVSVSAASSITNTTATINGRIDGNGNDNITDYGFYWSANAAYDTAEELQTSGTKVQKGTSNYTGAISANLTTLTAGNTIHYITYATNGQGTKLSSVQSFVVPYKVTVSKGTGCTSITNSGTNYTSSSITVTATKTDGYTFKSWSTKNGTQTSTSSTTTTNTLVFTPTSDNATISPTYTENMTAVTLAHTGNGHIEIGGETVTSTTAGVATTRTITAVPDAGYYFAGWTVSDGSDCNVASTAGRDDNESSSTTLRGLGAGTTGTVTANFVENEKIYFRDVFDDGSTVTHWGDVYVYFGIRWDNGEVYTHATNDSWRVHMTKILGTDVWWAYVPRSFTQTAASIGKQVAFSKDNQNGRNYGFYNTKAASRGDYNKALNMFVPYHVRKSNKNSVDYFDNGYWMKYDTKASQGAGYYLKKYNSKNNYTQKGEFSANTDDASIIQFKLRVDDTNDANNKYMIVSAGGLNYVADATITSSAYQNVAMSEDTKSLSDYDVYFQLKATSEGYYTFIINQEGDKMKLTIDYPASEGDYRLKHTYNDGSAKTTYSDVIKASVAENVNRRSMYLNSGGEETLVLQTCTGINGTTKLPEWGEDDATNLGGILTKLGTDGNGVYQFDITINTTDDQVSDVDSIRLYTGNYYIKTDAAPGGWVNYTRNIMDKNTVNFDRNKSATFDNYWCNYYESKDWNIKCVIANDYCNQLSDTIKGDGIARVPGGSTEPYVPIDGTSIRFSYNSATNAIGRAYLGASLYNDYLDIIPYEADYIFNSSSEDLYDYLDPLNASKLRFSDNGDYVYEIDLKVIPGGKAGVRATYNTSSVQDLIPSTNTVLGGSGETPYDVRVVYDFKTNYMMSAFVLPAEDEIADDLEDVDMLWVRHKDESATQVRFDGGSLSNVRVIGAIEFKYNEMCSSAASPVDLSEWNETSRPYLKYFVSFPFDVEMNSIFGLNKAYYGMDYVIQKYNGTKRAKEGLFAGDDDNYWENVQMGDTLFANEGYCVILDNDYARWSGSSDMWYNKSAGSSVFLYFPAMTRITSITNENCSTTVASHECKVNRTWQGSTKNHMQTDSHWNMIGSPMFHDAYIKDTIGGADSYFLSSFYYLNYADNKWYAKATKLEPMFKAMSSRLVQWCGTIGWTTNSTLSAYKAPSRTSEQEKNYLVNLELAYNGKVSDWTYVQLQDGADDDFILREDMYKMYNKGIPQIYTYAGAYDVAYNGVPVKNQTIPVGVVIRKNGTYTFSMPTNFSGTVTLIDTFAQTRTNLAFEDYEVDLQKGTIDDRFLLEIDINNAATAIDGAENGEGSLKDGKAHKFIQNGTMYILRDGVIYDAQGRKAE